MNIFNRSGLVAGLSGALLLLGVPAGAEFDLMANVDANGDGYIDRAEFDTMRAGQFGEIDANGDGFASAEEFGTFHRQRQASRQGEFVARMMKRLDADADGRITAEEWRADAQKKFAMADTNGDGAVTEAELMEEHGKHKAAPGAGPGGADGQPPDGNMMTRLDTDKDGRISAAEWTSGTGLIFARLDADGDGRIGALEMPRRGQKQKPVDGGTPALP